MDSCVATKQEPPGKSRSSFNGGMKVKSDLLGFPLFTALSISPPFSLMSKLTLRRVSSSVPSLQIRMSYLTSTTQKPTKSNVSSSQLCFPSKVVHSKDGMSMSHSAVGEGVGTGVGAGDGKGVGAGVGAGDDHLFQGLLLGRGCRGEK